MQKGKRALCLLLALALLAVLSPASAGAAGTLIFAAANEKLYPLSDETMPFWSDGVLYVPHTVLTDNSLEIFYNRNREKQKVSLYQLRSGLIFDLETDTAETKDGDSFSAALIIRGDTVYFPLDPLCPVFDLQYSYTRVAYGYLLRIRNSAARLSDSQYITAAASAMASRYAAYTRAHPEQPAANDPSRPSANDPVETQRTVYLAAEATDEAFAAQILSALPSGCAAFLFTPQSIPALGALARRLASGEGTVVLRIDGSDGAEAVLPRIAEGNRALWAAANVKTLLVYLEGADAATADAVAAAGYCPMLFGADFSGDDDGASRVCARIVSAADKNGGVCRAFLGTDERLAHMLSVLLADLRAENCTPARLSEIA